MKARLTELGWYVLFAGGSALVVYGVSMWSRPAAFILAGLELAIIGFLSGLDQARNWGREE